MKKTLLALVMFTTAGVSIFAQNVKVDPALPDYKKVSSISGNLNAVGSDTLINLMTFWGEEFKKLYPSVNVQVEGKGSSTAPPALIEGVSQLGPMSREMKDSEIQAFEKKYGFKPLKIAVAVDALAVYVNKENPLEQLSLPELDGLFSVNRRSGYAADIDSWGKLGLKDAWEKAPVIIGFDAPNVKTLKLSEKKDGPAYSPHDYQDVISGKYPLSRLLYIYVSKDPKKPLDAKTAEFLKMVLSKSGQQITIKDGYLPLTAAIARKQLDLLK
ncbi:hypothetical protein CHS0354_002065 [Potamilus streckersoni]|uniref:PBP domain-containing protein n=1 Tax=Potamilus streckersoni TaxID=2493646 RepID=A0AAE0T5L1_9BIVA|nr:hypothetical protein CHS0354_002065 [Potamilus streckersoni]